MSQALFSAYCVYAVSQGFGGQGALAEGMGMCRYLPVKSRGSASGSEDMDPNTAIDRVERLVREWRDARAAESGETFVLRKAQVLFEQAFGEYDNKYVNWLWNASDKEEVLQTVRYEFELMAEARSKSIENYDSGLWAAVKSSFEAEDWQSIPALTARYVEHTIREWSGLQRLTPDTPVLGKELANKAFALDGPLQLGQFSNEREGWQSLARGFFQALSNVDRHRIQNRADIREYATGVLGLASLLLIQIRFEHPRFAQAASA